MAHVNHRLMVGLAYVRGMVAHVPGLDAGGTVPIESVIANVKPK